MSYLFDSKSLYVKGLKYYKSKNYKTARMFFNSISENSSFYDKAKVMSVKVDIKEGRYLDAYNRVINGIGTERPEYYMLMALINEIQYNYDKSLDLLLKADKYSSFYSEARLKEAQVNLEYGYFSVFNKIIDSLKNSSVHNKSVSMKSMYYVINRDYYSALNELKNLDKKSIREKQQILLEKSKFLIRYLLDNVNRNERVNTELEYFKEILFDDSHRTLVNHLKEIYDKDIVYSSLNFILGINYKHLVEDAMNKIKDMNPNYHNFEMIYRMILPTPVGIVENREVYGLGVKTLLGTDKIIGMFPFENTPLFDENSESKSESLHKSLKLK